MEEMDWYYCENTDGSCEGYIDQGVSPSSTDGDNVCNYGQLHDWIFKGT